MENFLNKMAEMLEVESLLPTDEITSFEAWDSLTSLSVIAFSEEDYGVTLSAKDIVNAKTIEGLYQFIQSKKQ
jgi:acyl carrier protein